MNGSGETTAEPVYKCPKCRDTGWEEVKGENDYTFMRECSCGLLQRQKMDRKLKFAAIPKEFQNQTVESFMTDCYSTPQNRELAQMAKIIAKRYVEQFEEIQETGKGLYFYSSVKGSGKTRLAVSIANDQYKSPRKVGAISNLHCSRLWGFYSFIGIDVSHM